MAGETTITVIGNLVDDPELRFTPSGAAVANFRIASTPRTFDKNSNEWKGGETLFLRSSIWREAAENVAETLTKGMRVVAQGFLRSRSYEKDGQKQTVFEFEIDEIGPSLKWASAKVTRTQRNNNAGGFNQAPQQPQQQWGGQQQAAPAADPWAAPANSQQQSWGNGPDANEPPF